MASSTVSQIDLEDIVSRAWRLFDPPGTSWQIDVLSPAHPAEQSRWNRWRQIVGADNSDALLKRLAWVGLDVTQANRLIGARKGIRGARLPVWAGIFLESCQAARDIAAGSLPADIVFAAGQSQPYHEILAPFVMIAARRLRAQAATDIHRLTGPGEISLIRSLFVSLGQIGWRALATEFNQWRLHRDASLSAAIDSSTNPAYREFIHEMSTDNFVPFFQRHAVLARLLCKCVELWSDAATEFLSRLNADWADLQRHFCLSPLATGACDLTFQLADPHDGGRSVIVVGFGSETAAIVYKPRDLTVEVAYAKIVEWINRHCDLPRLQTLKVLIRPGYGWIEFARQAPCTQPEEVNRYFKRTGMLLALLHVLGGTDVHSDNLVAAGEQPIIVDLETLLTPRAHLTEPLPRRDDESPHAAIHQRLRDSVLRTGLLSFWQIGPQRQLYNLGALGEDESITVGSDRRIVAAKQTVESIWNEPTVSARNSHHGVWLDGRRQAAREFLSEIIGGFEALSQFLMDRRAELLSPGGPISALERVPLRYLVRATTVYASLRERLFHPNHLGCGVERSLEIDVLAEALLRSNLSSLNCGLLLQNEIEAFEQLDVPRFAVDSSGKDLKLPSGETLVGFFAESGLDEARRRLECLDAADCQFQVAVIRSTYQNRFRTPARPRIPGGAAPIQTTDVVAGRQRLDRA